MSVWSSTCKRGYACGQYYCNIVTREQLLYTLFELTVVELDSYGLSCILCANHKTSRHIKYQYLKLHFLLDKEKAFNVGLIALYIIRKNAFGLTISTVLCVDPIWTVVVDHNQGVCLGRRGVWFFRLADFTSLLLAMRVSPTAVRVPVSTSCVAVEQAQPQQVDQEPRSTDPDHDVGAVDLVGLGEPLDRLQDDGEAQRREEHRVHQRPHHLRPDPPEGVLVGRLRLLSEPHGDQSHQQRDNIRQHVERIRQHRQRRSDPTDDHFHDEEPERQ